MPVRAWWVTAVVALVALGAGVGIGAAAWGGGDHSAGGPMASTGPAEMTSRDGAMAGGHGTSAGTLDEQAFLAEMVPHHASAVAMAEIAVRNGQHPQVRRLARQIISSQEKEMLQMRLWYREWFGEDLVPGTMGPHATVDTGALEAATGDDLDRMFLAMMIPHHASAIMMADEVMMGGAREEVQTLAATIISAQAKEIGQMQRWREQWYPAVG